MNPRRLWGWSRCRRKVNGAGPEPTWLAFLFHLVGSSCSPLWIIQEHTSEHAPVPPLLGTNRYGSQLPDIRRRGLGEGVLRSLGWGDLLPSWKDKRHPGIPLHCRKQSSRKEREGPKVKWQVKGRALLRPDPHPSPASCYCADPWRCSEMLSSL